MPRGKTVLSYEEQEELCYRLLCAGFPGVGSTEIAPLFAKQYGIVFTESCLRRARDRLKGTPDARHSLQGKYEYLTALFALYPELSRAQARAKAKLAFGEDTREDVIEEMRRTGVLADRETARRIVEECERRVVALEGFDLVGGEDHGDGEDLEQPQK